MIIAPNSGSVAESAQAWASGAPIAVARAAPAPLLTLPGVLPMDPGPIPAEAYDVLNRFRAAIYATPQQTASVELRAKYAALVASFESRNRYPYAPAGFVR